MGGGTNSDSTSSQEEEVVSRGFPTVGGTREGLHTCRLSLAPQGGFCSFGHQTFQICGSYSYLSSIDPSSPCPSQTAAKGAFRPGGSNLVLILEPGVLSISVGAGWFLPTVVS